MSKPGRIIVTAVPERRLVAVGSAAEYAEVSDRTIRRWISSGIITGYRLGPRCVRVDLNELDEALRAIPAASTPA